MPRKKPIDGKPLSEIERPKCCGECAKFIVDIHDDYDGWCDNWGGVPLKKTDVCHPNRGRNKMNIGVFYDMIKRRLPQKCCCGGQPWIYQTKSDNTIFCHCMFMIACPDCGRTTASHYAEHLAMKEWNG